MTTKENSTDRVNAASIFSSIREEIRKVIVGQDYLIERLLVALIADGHVLLEGVPGLAKTKLLTALTSVIATEMRRIQFTPDLLPSDLIGTEVYRPQSGDFIIRHGPIFTNLLLADEINRAPAKVQSALLQAMQEREVTIGEQTFKLPVPFLVLATQNPIEQEGTYRLPEAQVDRFLMKLDVTYPGFEEEMEILKVTNQRDLPLSPVLNGEDLLMFREEAAKVYVDPKIDFYIVSLIQGTRDAKKIGMEGMIDWGASPRASIALKHCAKALAFVRGKAHVTPHEIRELAPDILRHRILTSFEAEAQGLNTEIIVQKLLQVTPVP